MGNVLQNTGGNTLKVLAGGGYGSVGDSALGTIYVNEDFTGYSLGADPDTVTNFSEVTAGSVISADRGGKSYKDVSQVTGTTEWANGFIHAIPSDLVEGDEAWVRMKIYIPSTADLSVSTGNLKWFRWQQHTNLAANAGYSDLYYFKSTGGWRYIKEGGGSWSVLTSAVDGPFDMEYDKWIEWEIYTKFHSTDGIVRLWKDGVLVGEVLSEATMIAATDVAKAFYFRTYWNGTGIPKQQDWYYDNFSMALEGAGQSDTTSLRTDAAGNKFIGVG